MLRWLTERRRRHILENPFPPEWEEVLRRNVAAYALLDDDERARLRQLVQVFIAEKHWEGCGGLELTDEMRVTIAGQACLLILGRSHDLFARVVSILVYPSTVVTPDRRPGFFVQPVGPAHGGEPIIGEAFRGETIIFSWDAVLRGARNSHDGVNVVFHEMAHAIDFLDGAADGTPPLGSRAEYRTWAEVCTAAYRALADAVQRGAPPGVLRDYGARNEAEFFAVATEAFFERPHDLAREHPALYAVLARFYNLDPARQV